MNAVFRITDLSVRNYRARCIPPPTRPCTVMFEVITRFQKKKKNSEFEKFVFIIYIFSIRVVMYNYDHWYVLYVVVTGPKAIVKNRLYICIFDKLHDIIIISPIIEYSNNHNNVCKKKKKECC